MSSLKDFTVIQKLGEGSFGQVFRVRRNEDSLEYALKKVKLGSMREKERENAVNEVRILASLSDEFVIGYKEAFYDQPSQSLCVIMQYASGGDILKVIETNKRARTRISERQIWRALGHMTRGLKSLHDNRILHRDLKCANVFITKNGTYKLGDLNVSKVLKKGLAHTQTGTPYYASPEVWRDQPYDGRSDIWSLGCVLYEMAALKPPFEASDLQGLYRKVQRGLFQRIPSTYSNDLMTVISLCLKVSPTARLNADGLLTNSIVQKNIGEVAASDQPKAKNKLLQTIRFSSRDLRSLQGKLPKANYDSVHKESSVPKEEGHPRRHSEQSEDRSRAISVNALKSLESKRDNSREIVRQRQPSQLIPPLQPNPSSKALLSPVISPAGQQAPRPPIPMVRVPSTERMKAPDPLDQIIKQYQKLKQKREERSKLAPKALARQPSRQHVRNRSGSKQRELSRDNSRLMDRRQVPRVDSREQLQRNRSRGEVVDRSKSRHSKDYSLAERSRNVSAIEKRNDQVLCRMGREPSKKRLGREPSQAVLQEKENYTQRNRVNSAGRNIIKMRL